MQDKAKFVHMIGEALHECATRTEVKKAEYVQDGYEEFVIVTFTDGSQRHICVTADSCLVIMNDVYKALH